MAGYLVCPRCGTEVRFGSGRNSTGNARCMSCNANLVYHVDSDGYGHVTKCR